MTNTQTAACRSSSEPFSTELASYIPALRSLARSLTRDAESAADLTQDTLAKAWHARSSFVPGTNLRSWLFTIMRNHFRSELRRVWRQMSWDQESAERIAAPKDEQTWSMELDDAARAIGALPVRQRQALIVAGLGGYSPEDAGAIMRCRSTAVKSRVCRARRAVASILDGTARLDKRRNHNTGYTIGKLLHELEQLTAIAV
ncbi:MAG TPA: sigma-70 family RNA polymerase sigma factor [Candidatus Acidoferrum sp.]|nr:sigma-70 family RNA polymerase sigma factor [Candidatus Acidoferrum sp.]